MRFETWFPVFTLILGQALVVAAEWIRERRQANRQQRKQYADFQHQVLLDLQESLFQFGMVTSLAIAESADTWSSNRIPLRSDYAAAVQRASIVTARVGDDNLRGLAEAVVTMIRLAATADNRDEAEETLRASGEHMTALNKAAGSLLRAIWLDPTFLTAHNPYSYLRHDREIEASRNAARTDQAPLESPKIDESPSGVSTP